MEIKWLRDHGLISSYADYTDLPFGVIEDASLLMEAEAKVLAAAEVRHRHRG